VYSGESHASGYRERSAVAPACALVVPNRTLTPTRGEQRGYGADRSDETATVIAHVGYFTTLRRSAWEIHSAYLRSHGAP